MVSELQTAVSTNQQKVTVALRNTTLQLKDTRREMGVIGRQVEELQESVSRLTKNHGVRDCSDVLARGEACSGVYAVKPDCGAPFDVYCDMETDGGGWTVFQRRQDGSVDFYLDFANYSRGFGNLEGEFWLGNDNLHRLTAQGEYELRVDLTGFDDDTGFALFESFSIADVSDNYRLLLGSYSGTAGNMLVYHNNRAFTTKDRDNDAWGVNCAERVHGAWWYRACYASNLNGRYFNEASTNEEGIKWRYFSGSRSLKTTEMKIRRKV
ncbi:ficolin-1-like isoform X2 [Asterias amurensis]|uniref:ficolin-1-like isoform X2 n=1 Tax=Asterias amurensis TaxID=7602 RepID=UPI003AB6F3BF